jgi:hypothetical protein
VHYLDSILLIPSCVCVVGVGKGPISMASIWTELPLATFCVLPLFLVGTSRFLVKTAGPCVQPTATLTLAACTVALANGQQATTG